MSVENFSFPSIFSLFLWLKAEYLLTIKDNSSSCEKRRAAVRLGGAEESNNKCR